MIADTPHTIALSVLTLEHIDIINSAETFIANFVIFFFVFPTLFDQFKKRVGMDSDDLVVL